MDPLIHPERKAP